MDATTETVRAAFVAGYMLGIESAEEAIGGQIGSLVDARHKYAEHEFRSWYGRALARAALKGLIAADVIDAIPLEMYTLNGEAP